MKDIKSTLDWGVFKGGNKAGNSTRQIDLAIQLLFSGYLVEIRDFFNEGNDEETNMYLYDKVLHRFMSEHRNDMIRLVTDRKNLSLVLNDKSVTNDNN